MRNHKITSGVDCKFKKGMVPANKGTSMSKEQYEVCKRTMFRKGCKPPNTMKLGECTHTTDGYVIKKVQEEGIQRERFKFLHKEVWEKYNGPIPKGMIVGFLDGNKDNCSIDNLFLIDKATNLRLNRKKLRFNNAELTKTGIKIAELSVAVDRRKKMNQRQKKKQFQKIYGKNPPEGWRIIERGNAIRKNSFIISKRNLRAFAEKIKTVFKELLEKFKRAAQAVSDVWKNFQVSDVQKQYKEDSTIVTTKALTRQRERRKREREWRRCWSQ